MKNKKKTKRQKKTKQKNPNKQTNKQEKTFQMKNMRINRKNLVQSYQFVRQSFGICSKIVPMTKVWRIEIRHATEQSMKMDSYSVLSTKKSAAACSKRPQ
jgi:hypothetical protein